MAHLPRRVLPIRGTALPLLDSAGTESLERRSTAGLPAHALMERAGASVARLALAVAPHAERIWIVAGPGNNGGDALEAALQLASAGREVELALMADPDALPADAAHALHRARKAGIAIGRAPVPSRPPALAIDGLLGVGVNRAPTGELAAAIRALLGIVRTGVPVLAIDLPSGLHASTGRRLGDDCVRATHTLALLTLKPGLVTGEGRDLCGEIWLDELGVEVDRGVAGAAPTAWLSGVDPARRPERRHAQNKGSFGDVAVVGGATGMVGAALLTARAAAAAGAGRVYVEWLDRSPALARLDPVHPELMFRDDWTATAADALERATVVCGCGGGAAVEAPLRRLLVEARRLVLDADALNAIAADGSLAESLRGRAGRRQASVLTPHPLEAARLLGSTVAMVEADRLTSAAELTRRFDCCVVLKGSGSIVATPGEVPRINATGNAALATAGTGDVLAGWLGGRWTQRRERGADAARLAFESACQAVAEHGAAAEPAPAGALSASDLIERLRAA